MTLFREMLTLLWFRKSPYADGLIIDLSRYCSARTCREFAEYFRELAKEKEREANEAR